MSAVSREHGSMNSHGRLVDYSAGRIGTDPFAVDVRISGVLRVGQILSTLDALHDSSILIVHSFSPQL